MRTDDLVKQLRAACNGYPAAEIAWPHRLLHEAADELERLDKLSRRAASVISDLYAESDREAGHHPLVREIEQF